MKVCAAETSTAKVSLDSLRFLIGEWEAIGEGHVLATRLVDENSRLGCSDTSAGNVRHSHHFGPGCTVTLELIRLKAERDMTVGRPKG